MTLSLIIRIFRGKIKRKYEKLKKWSELMRLAVRKFKSKPKEPKYVVRGGVKYHVMNIGGTEFEIRLPNKQDVEDFRNNKSTYSHPA